MSEVDPRPEQEGAANRPLEAGLPGAPANGARLTADDLPDDWDSGADRYPGWIGAFIVVVGSGMLWVLILSEAIIHFSGGGVRP